MGILQIKFETAEQWQEVLALLKKLHLEFHVLQSEEIEIVDELPDSDQYDAYRASIPALVDDWDDPVNDHWDNL